MCFRDFGDAEIDSAASGTIEQFGAPEATVYVGFNGVPPAVMMELHELLASLHAARSKLEFVSP